MQRQQIQIAYAPWGHNCGANVYLPNDYTPTKKYPVLLCDPGQGELGSNLALLEEATGSLPNVISKGNFINPATGKEYEIIVFAVQPPSAQGWAFTETQLSYLLSQFESLYSVDTTQIGVTGYSSGGNGTWTCLTDSVQFAETLIFLAPISAAPVTATEASVIVSNQAASKVLIWGVCGTADSFYAANESYFNALGKNAVFTTIQNGGHWSTQAYDPTFKGANGKNLYDTFLSIVTTPPPPPSVTVGDSTFTVGETVTVHFTNVAGTLIGSITGTIS
jgi:predicted peptidase